MGKKVLMIDGSSRKKNTYNILLQMEQILKAKGFDVEILNLFDYNLLDCIGCEACVTKHTCSQTDDIQAVLDKILESDGVVLSSPVYMSSATSRFKTFADRTNIWVHKPETAGMPMMFVTTTAATGIKEIKRFFNLYANGLGARKGGFIARAGKKIADPINEKEMSKFIGLLNRDKKYYRPAMDEIIMFVVGKILAKKSSGEDHTFWEEKQWMDKGYYYPCRINIFKKGMGKFLSKVISKAMA